MLAAVGNSLVGAEKGGRRKLFLVTATFMRAFVMDTRFPSGECLYLPKKGSTSNW